MEIFYSTKNYKSDEFLKLVLNSKGILDYEILKNSHGKPYIKGLFDFNISHTQGMIAIVIGKDVGIDVQKIRSIKDGVIKRVCSEEEIQMLNISKNRDKEFIRLWTFKEAFTKMIGSGFRYDFKNTNIENAICLHNDIKIYQRFFDDICMTALERVGMNVNVMEM